jgi:hypothetical protein
MSSRYAAARQKHAPNPAAATSLPEPSSSSTAAAAPGRASAFDVVSRRQSQSADQSEGLQPESSEGATMATFETEERPVFKMPPRHGTPPRHRPSAVPAVLPRRRAGRGRRGVTFAHQLTRSSSTGTPAEHNSRCGLLRPAPPLPAEPAGGKVDGEFFRFGSRRGLSDTISALHDVCARGNAQAASGLLGRVPTEVATEMLAAQDTELGWTALHQAAAHGRPAVVAALLQAGASADVEDDYGMTPLHLAAEEGCSESAELLVTKVRERRGSIEYLAERTGHHELGERLSAYWEIVAQIEKQQREEREAATAANGSPSPSPSSPPSSPTAATPEREGGGGDSLLSPSPRVGTMGDDSSLLDQSDGVLDVSLGAIRTVSASELPPPPPPVAPRPGQQQLQQNGLAPPPPLQGSWMAPSQPLPQLQPQPQLQPEPEPEPEPEQQRQPQRYHPTGVQQQQPAWSQQQQLPPPPQQQQYSSPYAYAGQQPASVVAAAPLQYLSTQQPRAPVQLAQQPPALPHHQQQQQQPQQYAPSYAGRGPSSLQLGISQPQPLPQQPQLQPQPLQSYAHSYYNSQYPPQQQQPQQQPQQSQPQQAYDYNATAIGGSAATSSGYYGRAGVPNYNAAVPAPMAAAVPGPAPATVPYVSRVVNKYEI